MTENDLHQSALYAYKDVVRDIPALFPEGETEDGLLRFKAAFLKGVEYHAYNEMSFLLNEMDTNGQNFQQP